MLFFVTYLLYTCIWCDNQLSYNKNLRVLNQALCKITVPSSCSNDTKVATEQFITLVFSPRCKPEAPTRTAMESSHGPISTLPKASTNPAATSPPDASSQPQSLSSLPRPSGRLVIYVDISKTPKNTSLESTHCRSGSPKGAKNMVSLADHVANS